MNKDLLVGLLGVALLVIVFYAKKNYINQNNRTGQRVFGIILPIIGLGYFLYSAIETQNVFGWIVTGFFFIQIIIQINKFRKKQTDNSDIG